MWNLQTCTYVDSICCVCLSHRHRVVLPVRFCHHVDRLHSLTAQASGQQQLRVNSSSISSSDSSPSITPESSPVKSNVYGFSRLPYARIPSMMFDKVMMVSEDPGSRYHTYAVIYTIPKYEMYHRVQRSP